MYGFDELDKVGGARFAWGPAALVDLCIERIRSLRGDIGGAVFDTYLSAQKKLSEMDLPGATVVMAAMRAPLFEMPVDAGGRTAYALVPPTYIDDKALIGKVDAAVEKVFGKATPIRAPFKTLAVLLGLAKYGRNNIAYVHGMGSYVRLRCYIATRQVESSYPAPIRPLEKDLGSDYLSDECRGCGICESACPTGAIGNRGFMLDASRCMTLVNEDAKKLPEWYEKSFSHCVVGCMRCQEACPMNDGKLQRIRLRSGLDKDQAAWVLNGSDDPEGRLEAGVKQVLKENGMSYLDDVFARNMKSLYDAGRL